MYEGSNYIYLVNSAPLGGDFLTLRKLSNCSTSPTITTSNIPVDLYDDPPKATQKDTSVLVSTSSAKLIQAEYRNAGLLTAHTINRDGRAAIRWYEINPDNANLWQSGTLASASSHYYFPSLAIDNSGNFGMVFNSSSSTQYISIRATGRAFTDQIGTLEVSQLVKGGSGPYTVHDPAAGFARWGDYSGTSIDPNGIDFWMYHMYAKDNNTWGSWITRASYFTEKTYIPLVTK